MQYNHHQNELPCFGITRRLREDFRKLISVFAFLAIIAISEMIVTAQTPDILISGPNGSAGNAVVADGFGNFYIGGRLDSPSHESSFAVIKYDSESQEIWRRHHELVDGEFDGFVQDVAIGSDGGIIAVGIIFEVLPHHASRTVWLMEKYDADGNLLWSTKVPSSGGSTAARDIVSIEDGFYVIGTVGGLAVEDWLTIRFDLDGEIVWQQLHSGELAGRADFPLQQAVDSGGNLIVMGTTINAVDQFGLSHSDLTVVKYSSSGELLWVRNFSDANDTDEIPGGMVVHSDGLISVTGISKRFEYISLDRVPFLLQLDANGKERMLRQGLGIGGTAIALDLVGNLVLSGTQVVQTNKGLNETSTISNIDGNGNIRWQNSHSHDGRLVIGMRGEIFLAGNSSGGYTVERFSNSGTRLWDFHYEPGGVQHDLLAAEDGSLLLTGRTLGHSSSSQILTLRFDDVHQQPLRIQSRGL